MLQVWLRARSGNGGECPGGLKPGKKAMDVRQGTMGSRTRHDLGRLLIGLEPFLGALVAKNGCSFLGS